MYRIIKLACPISQEVSNIWMSTWENPLKASLFETINLWIVKKIDSTWWLAFFLERIYYDFSMPVKLNLKHQPICKVGGSHNIYNPESARIYLVIKKPKHFLSSLHSYFFKIKNLTSWKSQQQITNEIILEYMLSVLIHQTLKLQLTIANYVSKIWEL